MKKRLLLTLVMILASVNVVSAEGFGDYTDRLRWSGFLSVGGGKSFQNDEFFLADVPTNSGYDNDVSFKPDTNIGLQLNVDLMEDLMAVMQLSAKGGDDFEVELAWGYLSYNLNDEWTVQAGRKRLPLFFFSETIDVGYTYHFIRPPVEIYNVSINEFQGASVLYTKSWDDLSAKIEAYYGQTDSDNVRLEDLYGVSAKTIYNDLFGMSASFEWNWLLFRMATAQTSVDTEIGGQTYYEGMKSGFYSIAMQADFDDYFLLAETVYGNPEEYINSWIAWYVSAGVRVGDFTPYVTYGSNEEEDDNLPVIRKMNSFTVGVRYDFHSSACLKAEYAVVNDESDMETAFYGDSHTASFAIDLVF